MIGLESIWTALDVVNADRPASSFLAEALEDLHAAVSDFRGGASVDNCQSMMARVIDPLNTEPMASFLKSVLPLSDFSAWRASNGGRDFSSGSRSISWPVDLIERIGLQLDFCRQLSTGAFSIHEALTKFYREGSSTSYMIMIRSMSSKLIEPMVRDIEKLTRRRPLSAAASQSLRMRPASTDPELDSMLQEACQLFASPVPTERQRALERLWDAWERAKTLYGDKKQSVAKLLDETTSDPSFRALLEQDALALTDAGNAFYIRHKETSQTRLLRAEEADYLFMRLHTLMVLLLRSAS